VRFRKTLGDLDAAKGAIDRHAKVKDEVATVLGERTRHHDAGREGPRRAPGKEVAHAWEVPHI
jgi:hypothetical protein